MARNEPQINFRVPEALKARIEAAAKDGGRTITAEIVYRLQEAYTMDDFRNHDESKPAWRDYESFNSTGSEPPASLGRMDPDILNTILTEVERFKIRLINSFSQPFETPSKE